MQKIDGRRAWRFPMGCAALVAALTFFGTGSVWVPDAQAVDLHALTPAGCISEFGSAIGCDKSTQGLKGASDLAVSPDGGSVYVASQTGDAIVRFNRATDGSLDPKGCFSDQGNPGNCRFTDEGLDGARDVAVSPDGVSVYVASGNDDAIVRFNRDPDGTLHPAGCIADPSNPDAHCGATQEGLDAAFGVAVSPDGASVYVASSADNSIVRFNRDPDGALTSMGCINDPDNMPPSANCGGATQQGLTGARDVVVSPDGGSVYVASQTDNAIVRFDRSLDGSLTPAGCISDVGDPAGCGVTQQGLNGAFGVAVSPDGGSAYVASGRDNTIVRFNRDLDGTLHPVGCIADPESSTDCGGATQQGLTGASNVAVSRDGASVYVASYGVKEIGNSAIVHFDRAPDGLLANGGCISDEGDPAGCLAATQQGLWGARGVAVSPDDGAVYVAGLWDDAIVRFKREVPPVCHDTAASGTADQALTVPLDCLDPNGDALTIGLVGGPANGALGPVDQASRTVAYTPNAGFIGNDGFSFSSIADGKPSNIASAFVNIVPPASQTVSQGPAAATTKLLALLSKHRFSGRSGRRLAVRFSTSNAGKAKLVVKRGRRTLIRKTKSADRAGVHRLMLRLARKRKPLPPGKYALKLTVTGADGQVALDSARLRVRR